MLKTSHSVDCFKQAVNRSELIREQKKDILPSSSQQVPIGLDLPEGFTIGKAIGGGDCFFDAVAQGLNQLKPGGKTFTAKSLRKICKMFAESQFDLDSSWLTEALKNDGRSISSYIRRIEFTADDIKKGYKAIDRLKLTTAIWGLPKIEGRIICIVYKVRLHFIKEHIDCDGENVIIHHLVDREGYQKGALDRKILNKEVYYREDTIHIINRGKFHFEPILRKQMLPNCYNIRASEKKLDSESVCFQQNSEEEIKDVTDNQMDYEYYKESSPGIEVLPTESTIGATVDYEDRLSNEGLQYKQSQESPRVTRSSSIGSSSTSTDDEEMFSCMSTTSDEIKEKMIFFVRVFVKVFEEKYSQISKEVRADSKILKTGRVVDECTSVVNDTIAPGLFKFALQRVNRFMGLISAKRHKREKKAAYAAIVSSGDNKREILVKAGLEIFQKFEKKMSRVVDDDIDLWEIAIEKLATDAVYRVINYISSNTQELSVNLITKGVILGRSKDDKFPKQLVHKSAKIFKFKPLESEYKVKDKQSSEIFTTSELYEKVGIKIIDGDTARCYRLKEHSSTERYGYRLLFDWELEERKGLREHESNIPNKEEHILKKILRKEYVFSGMSKKSHGYILDEEMEKLANSTLKEVSGKDPAKKKDIEGVCERFENVLISSRKKDEVTFSFNLGYLPEFFIKREVMLDELKKKLDSKNQEVEMSRMVLINGEHGTGKSELARSYGYDKENSTWRNIIWIDAKTPNALLSSFRNLAKELEIPTENNMDLNVVRDRGIESIVKDVYKYFRDVKSLFIFDNANNYEEIEKILPSHFSDLFFCKEKPYVLITSRNKNWEQEIEKIDLNDGFSLGESITFIERTLGIKDRSQNCYLVGLAEALNYLPLALTQAIAYIKQEKINVSEYLKLYNEEMQKPNPDRFEALGLTKELFITLTLSLDKIKRKENVGQQSNDIVAYMAYLNSNPINIVEIFLQKKSEKGKQQVLDALNLLNKFSVIELKESIARVHMGVQKTIRLEKEQAGTEEETLREMMTSFCLINPNHAISVWSHASRYDRLVNEFIDSIYDRSTILHLLAKGGNEKVIKLILEKIEPNKLSKVINAIDKMKCTPLDCAAMYGHLKIVKCFIEKGSDLDGGNRDLTPLHWAAVCGQLEVVKYFIDNEYWEVDKLSGEGGTPLHYAVISGNIDVVKYLVEKGADVNLQDENAGPLHFAAQEGRLDIVQYLIEKGASVNLHDRNGMCPLHYAIKNGFLDIAKCLITHGADINLKDKDDMSPLDYANESDRLDIIKYLVKKKAIANLCEKNVMSSLYYGTESDRLDIAEYLIKKKISIILNKSDKVSMSFFCCDGLYDRLNNIKSLIMRSTMVDSLNKEGMSSLYFAIIYGRLDLIEQLVREGADVNEQGREGMRPLHVATACNHLNIIDYLMTKGANINEQNREGLSPLHIAVIHAHLGSVKYLVGKEADIDLKDKCGVSPLLYALTITIGCPDISFRLIKYSSSLAQGVDVKSVFNTLLHNHAPVICYPRAQSLALDLRVQSHKRHQKRSTYFSESKKRKLENISATKENALNVELLQGSQNLPSDISMQFEDLADRMKDMVKKSMANINSEMPAYLLNSVSAESVNNKSLRR